MNTTLKTYAKIVDEFTGKRKGSKFWLSEYRTFKKFLKGKKILDIGCGTANEALFFIKDKFDYLGTDASPAMIRVAKRTVPKAKFKVMDMLKLKLPAESFDGFWACASLLHIPRKKLGIVMKSLHKILKDDGAGFISIKYKFRPWEGMVEDAYPGLKRFFSYHTPESFKKILKQNGFRVAKYTSKINHKDVEKTRWLMFYVKKL